MTAYYNEIDPYCVKVLRNLIAANLIAPGDVDDRSIEDVTPNDLAEYTQCHFFAGIGLWSAALRRAGWSDHRPVWTGSCPCQPFSAAGKGIGVLDERHLWPAWFHLIAECRPDEIFGEQVADGGGLTWFDLVSSDLEGSNYAIGALDLCAAGFGAPHRRQRLYFGAGRMADRNEQHQKSTGNAPGLGKSGGRGEINRMVDHIGARLEGYAGDGRRSGIGRPDQAGSVAATSVPGIVGHAVSADIRGQSRTGDPSQGSLEHRISGDTVGAPDRLSARQSIPGPVNGAWANADWLYCRDDKCRPVESGTFPLVDGYPGRVGILRAYGNGIVVPQAVEFIKGWMML